LYRSGAERSAGKEDHRGEIRQLVTIARVWSEKVQDADAAAEALEQVLGRDPENVMALTELARLYETTEQWDRCAEILEKAAALGPEPEEGAEIEFRLGRVKANQTGDEEAAALHYERALELKPSHDEAAKALQQFAKNAGSWDRVAELMETRARFVSEKDQLKIFCELGRVYSDKLKQPNSSVETWERARVLDSDNVDILTPLAHAYLEADRLDDAEPLLEQLVEKAGRKRNKQVAVYQSQLGAIASKRGDAQKALNHYEQAHKIDSTNPDTLIALGRIYFDQQNWDSARRIYRSMLLQNIEGGVLSKSEIFLNLGRVHAQMGEIAKAKNMFERGLEIDSDNAELKAELERM
ncbi:MAG: tetratricopeptide repeat protein, partial [Pseudomonadota bacterium]